jgi:hypothetical protein
MAYFLPPSYESPKTPSGYMKLQDGENKLRILTEAIYGWEDWKENKPIRYRFETKPIPIDPSKPIKHFWAFIVWNYTDQKIQIYEVLQASIRNKIEALARDNDWGNPFKYDLKIIKTGKQKDTKYDVNPVAPREIEFKIREEFSKTPIWLDALFSSDDPFKPTTQRTHAFWEKSEETLAIVEETISHPQVSMIEQAIKDNITPLDPFWEESALKAMKISKWKELKRRLFDRLMKLIEEKKKTLVDDEVIPF